MDEPARGGRAVHARRVGDARKGDNRSARNSGSGVPARQSCADVQTTGVDVEGIPWSIRRLQLCEAPDSDWTLIRRGVFRLATAADDEVDRFVIVITQVNGFRTATPVGSKWRSLRVTTVRLYISAVAAICLSRGFSARGTRSLPHIWAISSSNGRIASA